jgi:hypothetical protein
LPNAATLPIDKSSVFIRSERGGAGFGLDVMPMAPDLAACAGSSVQGLALARDGEEDSAMPTSARRDYFDLTGKVAP